MEISLLSSFTAFTLTEQEEVSGLTFHAANRALIQNHISAAAEEVVSLSLVTDSQDPTRVVEIAYLRGKIDALRRLLTEADTIEEKKAALQNQRNLQDPLV